MASNGITFPDVVIVIGSVAIVAAIIKGIRDGLAR